MDDLSRELQLMEDLSEDDDSLAVVTLGLGSAERKRRVVWALLVNGIVSILDEAGERLAEDRCARLIWSDEAWEPSAPRLTLRLTEQGREMWSAADRAEQLRRALVDP